MKKILLLGSGELGKEFVIAAKALVLMLWLVTVITMPLLCRWLTSVRCSLCSMVMR